MSERNGWDYTTNHEGGISTQAKDEFGGTVTKLQHYGHWDRKGAVDWFNRAWWSGAGGWNWSRLSSGFAALNFSGRDAYSKAYSDYVHTGGNRFNLYHRAHLWAKPSGQVKWRSVQFRRNGGWNMGHTVWIIRNDPRN